MLSTLLFSLLAANGIAALPEYAARADGVKITKPPRPSDTASKLIPDADHPYQAPGPSDLRGPCPGLNTLANHGYIPRNGVASFEQIVMGVTEGYNMDYDLVSAIASFGMMARGNAYTNQLSIGGITELIPPLPDNLDGNTTKGIATHGRFEGDISMTRQDKELGNNIDFQQDLFDKLLDATKQYGNDSDAYGPKSIINMKAMQEFRYTRYQDSVKNNHNLDFPVERVTTAYVESAFIMNFFANGTDGLLTVDAATSILGNQKFPDNHYRAPKGDIPTLSKLTIDVLYAHVPTAGTTVDGKFVEEKLPSMDEWACYLMDKTIGGNVPGVIVTNSTGILKENVDFLLNNIHSLLPDCPATIPHGPAGV